MNGRRKDRRKRNREMKGMHGRRRKRKHGRGGGEMEEKGEITGDK